MSLNGTRSGNVRSRTCIGARIRALAEKQLSVSENSLHDCSLRVGRAAELALSAYIVIATNAPA